MCGGFDRVFEDLAVRPSLPVGVAKIQGGSVSVRLVEKQARSPRKLYLVPHACRTERFESTSRIFSDCNNCANWCHGPPCLGEREHSSAKRPKDPQSAE